MVRQAPWWETALPDVVETWRRFVFHRVASWADSDDIIQDSLASLSRQLSARPEDYPVSWFGKDPPTQGDREHFANLISIVVRRRLHDHLRKRYRESAHLGEPGKTLSSSEGATIEQIQARRLLHALVKQIESLSESEKLLLDRVTGGGRPSTEAERKQLSRLRVRLAAKLSEDLSIWGKKDE